MRGYKRIRVFPDRDLRATRYELSVIDTSVFQRLRHVQQLGQASLVFPTAEHSRFSHSLGTLYWASKIIVRLRENHLGPSPEPGSGEKAPDFGLAEAIYAEHLAGHVDVIRDLIQMDEVGPFEQFVRLAALVHDITHLPFGHTLEDQAGLFERHDEHFERIDWVFAGLQKGVKETPHLQGSRRDAHVSLLTRILDDCKALYYVDAVLKTRSRMPPGWTGPLPAISNKAMTAFSLAHDIVGNTICSDLIDYLHRDTLFAGMPWSLDKVLFGYLRVLTQQMAFDRAELTTMHCGVALGRKKLRHDVITAVLGLLRARYDVTEKIYYHHTKCAADAVLEKAMRAHPSPPTWMDILQTPLGDEGLLKWLHETASAAGSAGAESVRLLDGLRSRQLPKAVYRLRKGIDWSRETQRAVTRCLRPAGRTAFEKDIADACKLPAERITVSCLPWNMQLKEARALIEWTDGQVLPLSQLPADKKYLPEITHLTERYKDLWALTVYLDGENEAYVGAVIERCEALFDRANDPLLQKYLQERYPVPFAVQRATRGVCEEAELAAVGDLGVAKEGGDPLAEKRPEELALDHLGLIVKARRNAGRGAEAKDETAYRSKRKAKDGGEHKADDDVAPQLELTIAGDGGIDLDPESGSEERSDDGSEAATSMERQK